MRLSALWLLIVIADGADCSLRTHAINTSGNSIASGNSVYVHALELNYPGLERALELSQGTSAGLFVAYPEDPLLNRGVI
jgi:hypothetical protein